MQISFNFNSTCFWVFMNKKIKIVLPNCHLSDFVLCQDFGKDKLGQQVFQSYSDCKKRI